jgi:carbonic anhydrase
MKTVEITYRFESDETSARARPADSAAALRRMNEGNRAFTEMFDNQGESSESERRVIRVDPRDVGIQPGGSGSPEQHPFAAVLGCSDARLPVGMIFNEGPNDLFVVRVAGNTLGDDVRGSLNYALEHLGESLKLVVVLGHSGCGAVTAAVDVFLNPAGYLALVSKHAIRLVVDRLLVVVHAAARRLEEAFGSSIARHPRYREDLVEVSVITNAALGAHALQRQIGGEGDAGVKTAYGTYGIAERAMGPALRERCRGRFGHAAPRWRVLPRLQRRHSPNDEDPRAPR